ncbi:MAG: protein-L-isoaspartate O-methyltransferase [Steroidobacterales bacterium]
MDTLAARQQMVDQQIRTWEVLDPRVLDALAAVPREAFVPPAYRALAFADASIPIGFGQTMLAPNLQGRILQALDIDNDTTALEVGTGTGYLCACLSLLAGKVHSIELYAELADAARTNLRSVGAAAHVETLDVFDPAPLGAYDAIAVTASLPVYDRRFEQALRIGGRLFVVVGQAPVMEAMLVHRVSETEWLRESLFETVLEALVGAPGPDGFVF